MAFAIYLHTNDALVLHTINTAPRREKWTWVIPDSLCGNCIKNEAVEKKKEDVREGKILINQFT